MWPPQEEGSGTKTGKRNFLVYLKGTLYPWISLLEKRMALTICFGSYSLRRHKNSPPPLSSLTHLVILVSLGFTITFTSWARNGWSPEVRGHYRNVGPGSCKASSLISFKTIRTVLINQSQLLDFSREPQLWTLRTTFITVRGQFLFWIAAQHWYQH
jgi:hypothetical protein